MKASERYQLQSKINYASNKINTLNSEKRKYQNLRSIINEQILPNLRNAKNEINEAKSNLKNSYSSTEATSRINSLQNCEDRISSMINTLNGSVIPEITNRINIINGQISNQEYIKRNASYKLRQG